MMYYKNVDDQLHCKLKKKKRTKKDLTNLEFVAVSSKIIQCIPIMV